MKYFTEDLKKAIIEGDKNSILKIKKIKKGIYIHVFRPTQDIYEYRKNGNHIIKSGAIVIKPDFYVFKDF